MGDGQSSPPLLPGSEGMGAMATSTQRDEDREQREQARAEKLEALHQTLTAQVAELVDSEAWQAMLRAAARFHRYSFGNVCMILAQRPTATQVAGFHTWRSLGRSVTKGEKGIAILATVIYKTKPTAEPHHGPNEPHDEKPDATGARRLHGFKVEYVFDIEQTHGEPLPYVTPCALEGDALRRDKPRRASGALTHRINLHAWRHRALPHRRSPRLDHPGAAILRPGTTAVLPVKGATRRTAIGCDREPPRRRYLPRAAGQRTARPAHTTPRYRQDRDPKVGPGRRAQPRPVGYHPRTDDEAMTADSSTSRDPHTKSRTGPSSGTPYAGGMASAAGNAGGDPVRLAVRDRRARPLRDLRISVTDRCNFRCGYCMPREVFGADHAFLPRSELLSYEELGRLVRVFADLGVSKIRLTGGEPLLRRDLEVLVSLVASTPGISDVALTTNGSLLAGRAQRLRGAGLRRVAVSLDSLDPTVFAAMGDTRVPLSQVLDGIAAAAEAGLAPVNLNAVLRRGMNEAGLLDLVEFARDGGYVLRFIEYMDVGNTNGWDRSEVVASAEVLDRVAAVHPVEPLAAGRPGAVAQRWRYLDGRGELGLVSSVSMPFCGTCTRARLTAIGELYTCLFATHGRDLRGLLRGGVDDEALHDAIAASWRARDDRYSELRGLGTADLPKPEMSYLGG